MPNGSNQYTKPQVQTGVLCYVCEKATPMRTDDIGGPICQACYTHMQNAILQHYLKSGYRVKTRKAK